MTSRRLAALLGSVGLVSLVAFSTAASGGKGGAKKDVTFTKDIASILYKNCAECHRPNDIAPMSLLTYKEARPWAKSIREKVVNREMPPWSPDPKYGEFKNDHRLSQSDIDTIVAWVDAGSREGSPKDLPALPEFINGWQIGKPDAVLSMSEEHTVDIGSPDNYINFTIPTNFTEDKWVQAAEIRPGNKKVVHHVIAFIQTPEMIARAKAAGHDGPQRRRSEARAKVFYRDGTLSRVKMDAPVVDDGCSNPSAATAGQNDEGLGTLLAGFAPGKGVDIWEPGIAKKVPAGSSIVFQMHYSSFRGALEKPEKDRTSIGLVFSKEVPRKVVQTLAVANLMFKIPPGEANHEVTACTTLPRDIELIGYMPHMHLRGKDMKYEVIYPDGRRETLLWVPKFNFNWQAMYDLKKPVLIPKGSKFIVTAHFDNSAKNKYNPDASIPVRWGDPTYDEMMIGWLDAIFDNSTKADVTGR